MKEQEILSTIESVIGNKYIGDDCAYLEDLGVVVSQDSLVEGVHFNMDYTTPYQLGYKSVMVNISDICASGGVAKYITIALSLPFDISNDFVKSFYEGAKSACGDVEIIGGDITGAEKIMVSVTAIGMTEGRKISSRKNAKEGYVIVTSGVHGSSAGGLKLLNQNRQEYKELIRTHLMPEARINFTSEISKNIKVDYAMIDSSDGLADALYKIAEASNKTIVLDFNKVTFDGTLKELFPDEYEDMILYGGEDYQIIAALPEDFANRLNNCIKIGKVEKYDNSSFLKIKYDNKIVPVLNLDKCFNHF